MYNVQRCTVPVKREPGKTRTHCTMRRMSPSKVGSRSLPPPSSGALSTADRNVSQGQVPPPPPCHHAIPPSGTRPPSPLPPCGCGRRESAGRPGWPGQAHSARRRASRGGLFKAPLRNAFRTEGEGGKKRSSGGSAFQTFAFLI